MGVVRTRKVAFLKSQVRTQMATIFDAYLGTAHGFDLHNVIFMKTQVIHRCF